MTTVLIVWAAILALWTIASVAYYFYLQSIEKVAKERNTNSHSLSQKLAAVDSELFRREIALKQREEDLKAEEKSCRETEERLAAFEAELAKRESELYKKELEIETKKAKKSKVKAE